MDFMIKCDVYKKLAQVTKYLRPPIDTELQHLISCVRIENKNNNAYAIATNKEIASIYYLGETQSENGHIDLIINDDITKQAEYESSFSSLFYVTSFPEFATATLKSLLGWEYSSNVGIFPDSTPLDKWRTWFPDKPITSSRGFMYWDLDQLSLLANSSPSGKIYFPAHIDVEKPIILRDVYDENWCGLFIPNPDYNEKQLKESAGIPKWV